MNLSIIIPIYKVEQYLCKCVDSVLNQDYEDYEIILVDDGSPDKCPLICDGYAKEHVNINVIHQENGGLSAARNAGLNVAKGEYVMFVDSDDYVEQNVLGTLVQTMEEKQLDVLRFNYQNVNEQYEIFLPYKDAKRDVNYSENVVDGETFLNERLGPMCYAVMFMMRREILEGCLFKEGIYFEDTEWTPRMLLRAKRVASTPMVVYNYLRRTGSITLPTDSAKRQKVLEDKILLLRGFQEQRKHVKDSIWYDWMISMTTIGILNMLASIPKKGRESYIIVLKKLRVFPLLTKREKMLTHRFKILMANISPSLYCTLMSLRL